MQKLNIKERLILRNQFKMLYKLSTDFSEKSHYKEMIELLEKDFEKQTRRNKNNFGPLFESLHPDKQKKYPVGTVIPKQDKNDILNDDGLVDPDKYLKSDLSKTDTTVDDFNFDDLDFDSLDFNNDVSDPFADGYPGSFSYDPSDNKSKNSKDYNSDINTETIGLLISTIICIIICVILLYYILK